MKVDFVILSRSRTGSNYLTSLLNSHPNITMGGEIFKTITGKPFEKILEEEFAQKWDGNSLIGCKVFYYHPLDTDIEALWKFLLENKNLKIIHLKRENKLRIIVSQLIASKTKQWHLKNKPQTLGVKERSIMVDIEDCLENIQRTKVWEDEFEKKLENNKILNVLYEEMTVNVNPVMDSIFEFLDIASYQVKSSMNKQNTESLENIIVNYDELALALKNNGMSQYLD